MANENKSNSELYREKRKERLEKVESKKVKSHKGKRSKKLAYALIIVAVIVAISAFFLNFFGVPQRLQSAVITDDGTKISVAEYEYYYRYWFNTYHTQSKQYEDSYASYYGEGAGLMMTGYDANKTPENQKYSGDLDKDKYGKEPTWADFFEDISVQYCFMYDALEKLAIEKGMKITKEEKKELDEHMSSIVAVAKENNFSFDAYLRKTFGNGMNEKLLRRIFEKQTLASKYIETLQEEKKAAVTPEDILKNYNENKNDYNIVDLRMFYNASEPAVAKENEKKTDQELEKETKAAADKVKSDSKSMLDAVTDEASFIRLAKEYATEAMKENYEEESATLTEGSAFKDMSQYISEDAAKWMFDEQRKIGDKNMFTVEHDDGSVNCYVLYILKPSYRDDTPAPVSVRHILVAFDDDPGADGEKKKISKEVKEQKLKEAQSILDSWKNGKSTEDSFADLATKKSDDEGSAETGGLIEDIYKNSNFVKPFIDWSYEKGRKVGDTGIIETVYGYHIMYCSKISTEPQWKTTILNEIVEEEYGSAVDKLIEERRKGIRVKDSRIGRIRKKIDKHAASIISRG